MAYKIFLVGATGYIGGSVLYALQQRPDASEYEITAMIRDEKKAEGFNEIGVKTVIGDFKSTDLLRDESAKADMVISIGDCDDTVSVGAMLEGLKLGKQKTGKAKPFFHTSGTGVFTTMSGGSGPKLEDPIWDDNNSDQLEQLPKNAWHREVDLMIVEAHARGDCISYIILPSTIYGEATGELGKGKWKGKLMNRRSRQIPIACQLALQRGQPGVVGEGKNVWPQVHLDDLMDLYMIIFDLAKEGKGDVGRDGYYAAETGHYENVQVAQRIGQGMKKMGLTQTSDIKPYGDKELEEIVGKEMVAVVGSGCRCTSNRSRKFGWKPKYDLAHFYDSIEDELQAAHAQLQATGGKGQRKW